MYFDIIFEDYNAEEDGVDLSDRDISSMESNALRNVGRLLKVRVGNRGHDSSELCSICNISVTSLEDVAEIISIVKKYYWWRRPN